MRLREIVWNGISDVLSIYLDWVSIETGTITLEMY